MHAEAKTFNEAEPLTASGQNCWPPTGSFVTAHGQDLMAAECATRPPPCDRRPPRTARSPGSSSLIRTRRERAFRTRTRRVLARSRRTPLSPQPCSGTSGHRRSHQRCSPRALEMSPARCSTHRPRLTIPNARASSRGPSRPGGQRAPRLTSCRIPLTATTSGSETSSSHASMCRHRGATSANSSVGGVQLRSTASLSSRRCRVESDS